MTRSGVQSTALTPLGRGAGVGAAREVVSTPSLTLDAWLEQADAEISRCIDCGDWRWRASYLACQQCGAPSLAARLCPPIDDAEEIGIRWRAVSLTWAGLGRQRPQRRRKAAA